MARFVNTIRLTPFHTSIVSVALSLPPPLFPFKSRSKTTYYSGPAPLKGCKVFVGKIPRDLYEDELVPVFEKIGKIYELRLMMDFSGSNRGYAFVMFTSVSDARRAVKVVSLSCTLEYSSSVLMFVSK